MLFLGIKRFLPIVQHKIFNDHPFGNWDMYSKDVHSQVGKVFIKSDEKEIDITEIANKYLWHNFENFQFVCDAHHHIPIMALKKFPTFLSSQQEIIELANKLNKSSISFEFSVIIQNKKYNYKFSAPI